MMFHWLNNPISMTSSSLENRKINRSGICTYTGSTSSS